MSAGIDQASSCSFLKTKNFSCCACSHSAEDTSGLILSYSTTYSLRPNLLGKSFVGLTYTTLAHTNGFIDFRHALISSKGFSNNNNNNFNICLKRIFYLRYRPYLASHNRLHGSLIAHEENHRLMTTLNQ